MRYACSQCAGTVLRLALDGRQYDVYECSKCGARRTIKPEDEEYTNIVYLVDMPKAEAKQ